MIDIERLTNDYIKNNQSYKQTVSNDNEPIGYKDHEGIIDERNCYVSHYLNQ